MLSSRPNSCMYRQKLCYLFQMKQVKSLLAGSLILASSFSANAQQWVELMQNDTVNFYDVQAAFNSYWAGRTIEKGKGWKAFKRWEWFNEQRLYPSGKRIAPDFANKEFQKYMLEHPKTRATNGNWTTMGPVTVPSSGGGAGRVNCVRFDPTNINIVWAGTPAGGLWKSTNAGASWTAWNTNDLQSMGVYDIAIDPTNSNIMYIATGDLDGSDTYSIGVLKSTDGGLTWNSTGLSYGVDQGKLIARLIIDPTNTNIIYAAGNGGVFKSTDGGVNWVNKLIGNFRDLEMKPGSPNTLYVCGTIFKYSTDGGTTWVNSTASFTLINRMSIAVTPANPAYVYILASNSGDNGFHALMRSTDSGVSFTTMADRASDPNILGWNASGSDAGGQGWYDLALAVSPTNANVLYTGGVNIWKSTNGGSTLAINAHWTGGGGAEYVHADIHDLQFAPGSGSIVYAGCDGGVFKTINSGTDWTDQSDDLNIGQLYKLGVAQTDPNKVMTGWQDNGSNLYNGGTTTWDQVLGGDGMECAISFSSASVMYGSLYYGDINKSTNGGASFSGIVGSGGTGVHEDGAWVTPYMLWAGNSNHLYVGKTQVWRSTNAGSSFTQMGTLPTGGNLSNMYVAPSNANYIYVSRSGSLYMTSTGGSTWINKTSSLPPSAGNITSITVSNTDPNKVFLTFSGYNAGQKVYQSNDGGDTWTNLSGSLPNLPANTLVRVNGSNDALYVGMDIGVYYKDGTMSDWVMFNQGLPNTVVSELEIQYSTSKLRAATYGRGLWQSDLFTPPAAAPVPDISANYSTVCVGIPVQFTDLSTNIPTSWSWNFGPSASPATSTLQDPVVIFTAPGTYSVTLQATNGIGTGSNTFTNIITVLPEVTNNIIQDDQIFCTTATPATLTGTTPSGGFGSFLYGWMRSYTSATSGWTSLPTATAIDYSPITTSQDVWYARIVSSGNCKDTSNIVFIDMVVLPAMTITNTAGTLTIPDNGYMYQWYLDGVAISGATDTFHVALAAGTYTVMATDTNGCTRTSPGIVVTSIQQELQQNEFSFWPNPAHEVLNLQFGSTGIHTVSLVNSLNQQIAQTQYNGAGQTQIRLDGLAKGVYFIKVDSGNGIHTHKLVVAHR